MPSLTVENYVKTIFQIVSAQEDRPATTGQIAALKPKVSVRPVRLRLARERVTEDDLTTILNAVMINSGPRPLIIEFVRPDGSSFEFPSGDEFGIGDERALLAAIAPFVLAA